MKQYFSKKNNFILLIVLLLSMSFLISCNKDVQQMGDIQPPVRSGETLGQILRSNPDDSLYYRLIVTSGQSHLLDDSSLSFTLFVPNNNSMKKFIIALASQLPNFPPLTMGMSNAIFSNIISTVYPSLVTGAIDQYKALVQYNTMPQAIKMSNIPTTFPNFFYPSCLNPDPSISPLARMNIYPSILNGKWINNLPIIGEEQLAYNGVIHHTASLLSPLNKSNPLRGDSVNIFLWDRIKSDTGLTYLKAAILRADSGALPTSNLCYYLSTFGPNFTVFAPTNEAFQNTLKGLIAQTLISQGVPQQIALAQATALSSTPDVFNNSLLYSVLTAEKVKGLIAYHLLGSRAFTNNFPTNNPNPQPIPTLLTVPGMSNALPVFLNCKFGMPFVDSATVKGLGNPAPVNIIINSTPLTADPDGTSDQLYLNGILHKIDGILMPQ